MNGHNILKVACTQVKPKFEVAWIIYSSVAFNMLFLISGCLQKFFRRQKHSWVQETVALLFALKKTTLEVHGLWIFVLEREQSSYQKVELGCYSMPGRLV